MDGQDGLLQTKNLCKNLYFLIYFNMDTELFGSAIVGHIQQFIVRDSKVLIREKGISEAHIMPINC